MSENILRNFAPIPVRAALDDELGAAALRVLILITAHVGKDGTCYPSQNKIAKKLNISRQAVGQSVKKLATRGYIESEKLLRENGSFSTNRYRVLYTLPMQDDLATPQDSLSPMQALELATITNQ